MTDVLVIEDDAETRDLLRRLIGEAELTSHGVADGRAALDWLGAASPLPRLMLLNLYMPGMNGFDFRAAQLADPRLSRIPTLVLTGNPNREPRRVRALACPVLAKPFVTEDLKKLLREHVL